MLFMTCLLAGVRFAGAYRSHISYSKFEIHEYRSRHVELVVGLIEKHVFSITSVGRPLLENSLLVDTMLCA